MRQRYSLKRSLGLMGVSAAVFAVSILLHNAVWALFDMEEPVFLSIAVFLSVPGFVLGLAATIFIIISRLRA